MTSNIVILLMGIVVIVSDFGKLMVMGSTTDLNEAWKMTEKDAAKICSDPDRRDFAIYSDIAEKAASLHVNSEIYRELIRELEPSGLKDE